MRGAQRRGLLCRSLYRRPVFVYRTRRPVRGITPRGVWDSAITGERWIIPPADLILDRVIPADVAWRICRPFHEFHSRTGKKSNVNLRLRQYRLALEILGGEPWETELVRAFFDCWARRRTATGRIGHG